MLRKITLQNFMAHKLTVIEPAEGLTVLAGPNNCGKSAVVEALQVLAANTGRDFMVRHGESECRITVETSEGDEIQWRRKGSVVSYEVNGKEIHRLKGSVPDEVTAKLRLNEVEGPEGKEKFAVHFGTQKEPIFLLDQSGRNTASFFASFSDAARLMEMQQAHKRKVVDARAEEKILVQQEERLARRLESLAPVDQLLPRVERMEADYAALKHEMAALDALDARLAALQAQADHAAQITARQQALAHLPALPEMDDVRALTMACSRVQQVRSQLARAEHRALALRPLALPPAVEETLLLERHCQDMHRRQQVIQRQSARARIALPAAPEVTDFHPMDSQIMTLRAAHAELVRRTAEFKQADSALSQSADAIARWAAEHPLCPTCGTPLTAERLLAGHDHRAAGGGGTHA